jgi:hypothetical protein
MTARTLTLRKQKAWPVLCRSANEVEAVAATYFDEVRPLAIGKAT